MYQSQSENNSDKNQLEEEENALRRTNKTIDASEEDLDESRDIGVDRNNNVITSNMFNDGQSDQESIDLGLHARFPQVRQKVGEVDSDSEVSDAYTAKDSFIYSRYN